MALGWRTQYLRYRDFFLNIFAVYRRRQDVKMFLEIILSFATISGFALLAIRPTILTIAGLVTEIRAKEETVAKMDQKIQDLKTARTAFNQESGRISLIESAVPLDPQVELFVRQIEGLSSSNSLNLLGISIGEVVLFGPEADLKKETKGTALPESAKGAAFSVSVSGNYPTLLGFMSGLEKLRRPTVIDTAALNFAKSEATTSLILAISGRTPYLGANQQVGNK